MQIGDRKKVAILTAHTLLFHILRPKIAQAKESVDPQIYKSPGEFLEKVYLRDKTIYVLAKLSTDVDQPLFSKLMSRMWVPSLIYSVECINF